MTPRTCSSCSSAVSAPVAAARTSTWRSSPFERQVPMIEQCKVSESSQTLLRLAGDCGDGSSDGSRNLKTASDRRSSFIAGTVAVAARRLAGSACGSDEDTKTARYTPCDIASMAENGRAVKTPIATKYSSVYSGQDVEAATSAAAPIAIVCSW